MEEKIASRKRVEWVDLVKGVTILLVIAGHTLSPGGKTSSILRGMIYSFHMPLFFILSAYTFRPSSDLEEFKVKTKKLCRTLGIPVVLIVLFDIVVHAALHQFQPLFQFSYWKIELYRILFASATGVNYAGTEIVGLGMAWFLFALFFGRILFDYCHIVFEEKQLFIACLLLSISGILIGQSQYTIFSIDIALAIQLFFYFGYKMKSYDFAAFSWKRLLLFVGSWLLLLLLIYPNPEQATYLELAVRRYNLFPLFYLDALAGTLFLVELSLPFTRKLKYLTKPFSYLGRNSIYLLCIHTVDGYWNRLWLVEENQAESFIRRVVIDLIFFCIFCLFHEWNKRRKAAGLAA